MYRVTVNLLGRRGIKMINGKNIVLGHGDLRISSMRCNNQGVVAIAEQPKHEVWERVDNPRTAQECCEQADTNIVIDNLSGAEVLVSKLLESMLYHQCNDDVANLVDTHELFNGGKSDFMEIIKAFVIHYDFD